MEAGKNRVGNTWKTERERERESGLRERETERRRELELAWVEKSDC